MFLFLGALVWCWDTVHNESIWEVEIILSNSLGFYTQAGYDKHASRISRNVFRFAARTTDHFVTKTHIDAVALIPLKIGRWQNLPIPERECLVCAEDAAEDEFHFFCCICKKHKDISEGLYNKAVSRNVSFASLSNDDKIIYLMKFENVEVAKFLIRAYEVRNGQLYCT